MTTPRGSQEAVKQRGKTNIQHKRQVSFKNAYHLLSQHATRALLCALVGLGSYSSANAMSLLEGKWQSTNGTGTLFNLEIKESETGALYAKVLKRFPSNIACHICRGKYAGKKLVGAVVLDNLMQTPVNPKLYKGDYFDVFTGKTYPVEISITHGSMHVKSTKTRQVNQLWKPISSTNGQ